jgi:hypothetical protein
VGCSGVLWRREKSLPPLGIELQFFCRPARSLPPPVSRLRHAESNVIFLNGNSRVVQAVGSEFETNWLVFSLLALTL